MDKCKDKYLYMIRARNAKLGVYVKSIQGFKISRNKFKANFIDIEDHWDTGEPHGTASPYVEIGPVEDMTDEELLIYLNKKNVMFFGREDPMRVAK